MKNRVSIHGLTASLIAREDIQAQIEQIFWETAAARDFPSVEAKQLYCERWLGRYLRLQPGDCFIALNPDRSGHHADSKAAATSPQPASAAADIAGYLAGCLSTFSDDAKPVIADIAYYAAPVLEAAAPFPAHFHVNLSAAYRGKGIGRMLIETFARHCRLHGIPGVHIVTAAETPAAKFYEACGFSPRLDFETGGRRLVLYAMSL